MLGTRTIQSRDVSLYAHARRSFGGSSQSRRASRVARRTTSTWAAAGRMMPVRGRSAARGVRGRNATFGGGNAWQSAEATVWLDRHARRSWSVPAARSRTWCAACREASSSASRFAWIAAASRTRHAHPGHCRATTPSSRAAATRVGDRDHERAGDARRVDGRLHRLESRATRVSRSTCGGSSGPSRRAASHCAAHRRRRVDRAGESSARRGRPRRRGRARSQFRDASRKVDDLPHEQHRARQPLANHEDERPVDAHRRSDCGADVATTPTT